MLLYIYIYCDVKLHFIVIILIIYSKWLLHVSYKLGLMSVIENVFLVLLWVELHDIVVFAIHKWGLFKCSIARLSGADICFDYRHLSYYIYLRFHILILVIGISFGL